MSICVPDVFNTINALLIIVRYGGEVYFEAINIPLFILSYDPCLRYSVSVVVSAGAVASVNGIMTVSAMVSFVSGSFDGGFADCIY